MKCAGTRIIVIGARHPPSLTGISLSGGMTKRFALGFEIGLVKSESSETKMRLFNG